MMSHMYMNALDDVTVKLVSFQLQEIVWQYANARFELMHRQAFEKIRACSQ